MSKVREALEKAKRERMRASADDRQTPERKAAKPARADDTSAKRVQPSKRDEPRAQDEPNLRQIRVDIDALRREGMVAPENQEHHLANEYRQIKRPLISNVLGRGGTEVPRANLIAVMGSVPSEGKTFTCLNLALSIAREKDWRVLLVDCDTPKPRLSTVFGLRGEPGILDLLRKPELSITDVLLTTDIPGLSIIPAGRQDDHATELLASRRMEAVAEELSSADPSRVVLFDTSPLLLTAESSAVASHVGQIVVVVRAGHTTQNQLQQAVGKLDQKKAIGLVLNQSEVGIDALGYGYPYGYGTQYGSQPDAAHFD